MHPQDRPINTVNALGSVRAMESVPEKDKWMVVMLLMTFDHMFIMRKLGYHALSRDEEDHVIDTIMKTAAENGLSMQSAGSPKN